MNIGQEGRAGLVRTCRHAALLMALWLAVQATGAATPKPPVPAKPVAAKGSAGAAAPTATPEVQLAPVPAWVQPVPVDATVALPAAPVQILLIDRQTRLDAGATVRYSRLLRRINDAAGLQKGS